MAVADATNKKVDFRREVVLQTRHLVNVLKAYYNGIDDNTHDAALNKPASSWNRLADTNVVSDVRNILALAQTVAAGLADYNIDAAWLTAYTAKINAYEKIIPRPRLDGSRARYFDE